MNKLVSRSYLLITFDFVTSTKSYCQVKFTVPPTHPPINFSEEKGGEGEPSMTQDDQVLPIPFFHWYQELASQCLLLFNECFPKNIPLKINRFSNPPSSDWLMKDPALAPPPLTLLQAPPTPRAPDAAQDRPASLTLSAMIPPLILMGAWAATHVAFRTAESVEETSMFLVLESGLFTNIYGQF